MTHTRPTERPFDQQVCVVTGASSGIGRAIARTLAQGGGRLALIGRNETELRATAEPLKAQLIGSYQTDLNNPDEIDALQNQLRDTAGHVDILVHSAGVFDMAPLADTTRENIDTAIETNLRAPMLLTQSLLPLMTARDDHVPPQIVFVNSTAGLNAPGGMALYSATKHALRALADSLRAEVNPLGIRVLTVYPGRTATPMQEQLHEIENRTYNPDKLLQPKDIASVVCHALALPPTAEVTDITIRPFIPLR